MTVQNEFSDWGRSPMTPDPQTCAPIGRTWMSYLRGRWGGQDLGCYAPRPVVGGTTPSTHASGAAIDWRYESPGIGRSRMLNEIMPGLLSLSRDLGVQAVHDYVGCRIWRPPGTSGRPTSPSPECGWRQQTPGSQMGQSWALWLHIECLNTRWSDTRTVEQMLAGASGGGSDTDNGGTIPQPPTEEDDMATVILRCNSGSDEQNAATFWWDGKQIGWVRSPTQNDVGVVCGLYTPDGGTGRPLTNFRASEIQQMIDSGWAGGPVPAGFRAPTLVDSAVS